MRGIRRSAVIVAAATSMGLAVPAVSSASPVSGAAAAKAASPTRPGPLSQQDVRALALPPYEQWLADVSVVTNQASDHLQTRLPDASRRTAIVLDIDNTALQTTYQPGLSSPATPGVIELARQADAAGAAVFFVTARPELLRSQTQSNLNQAGYPRDGLYMRGWLDFRSDQALKTANRTAIERLGYTIVANIGNNTSDLAGGHAERTFKLPDYDGQLS